MKRATTLSIILALFLASGCSSRKPPQASVPVLAQPPVAAAEPSPAGPEVEEPAEPALGAERVVVPPLMPGELVRKEPDAIVDAEPPGNPAPARRSRPQPAGQAARTAEAEPATDTERGRTEPRPPSLKPMMTDMERRQLEAQTQVHLERARRNLAGLQENRLADNERSVLQEARSFAARAEQLRQADPAMANSLAERAAILTQELLRRQR